MSDPRRLELLAHGAVEVVGRVAGSSNQALFVELALGDEVGHAIYKAERGERSLWDFPRGLWRREVAAFELDEVLATGLVPETVGREDLPYGPGSLQWWVDDNGVDHYFTLREREEFDPWFASLGCFDVVANNADRKSGHVIYDGERCWAIDNGLCFHADDKLRTVIWEHAGREVDPTLRERVARLSRGETGALASWLSPLELALTMERAEALADHGTLPVPDEDRDWPPYPWPLV
jgi:uncharacterized repeat protein (TIGR03843 family)